MELALSIDERIVEKQKYTLYRPKGSVLVGMTNERIRRKWVEILGDLFAPYKREQYTKFPYYNQIVPMWNNAWKQAADEMFRRNITADEAWNIITQSGDIFGNLPLAPGASSTHVTDTWVWSQHERRIFYIVKADQAAAEASLAEGEILTEVWFGKKEIDSDGNLWNEHSQGKRFRVPAKMANYENNWNLPAISISRIHDLSHALDPDVDRPLHPNLFEKVNPPR